MKYSLLLLLLPGLAAAAILPDAIGPYHRTAASKPASADRGLWDEYGLKDSETATYESGKDKLTVIAYQLQDSTAALGVFDWLRPADAKPSPVAELAAQTDAALWVVRGNYLILFQGHKPPAAELSPVLDGLRNVDTTPFPTLPGYLPSQNLVANSERYITGPAALQRFDPGIPPSVAAFHLGAEAQLGTFHSPKGDMTLAIFNYPTNQIAMQKQGDFQKLPGAVVKRSGPLLAVLLSPPDPDAAERLLSQIRWEAQVTLDEYVPTARDNPGVMLINIFVLIGLLLALALAGGVFVGVFRAFLWRGRKGQEYEPMILLHLERR